MKILLISSAALPTPCPGYGGTEIVVYNIALELVALGHQVSVVATSHSKMIPEIEYIDAGEAGKISEEHLIGAVGKRINDGEWDIVHDHTWGKHTYLFKKNNDKIKLITTLHGMNCYGSRPPVKFPNMVCLSQDHAMEIMGQLGIICKWVYNGIDLNFYKQDSLTKRIERYLWLGRYMKGKGPHIALEVARQTGCELMMVGDDTMVEDPQYVRDIMQTVNVTPNAHYWGPVPRERALQFFQESKGFLQCGCGSWKEPYGLVTVESLACGTPVIALRNGATTELIQKGNDKYIDKGGVGVLCSTLEDMIKAVRDNAVSKIQPSVCRQYAEEYSSRNMALGYLKLYEEILNGKEW